MYKLKSKKEIFVYILTVLLIVGALVFVCKTSESICSIISNPNAEVLFSTQDDYLEQTWTPHIKNIKKIEIQTKADSNFEGIVKMTVLSKNREEVASAEIENAWGQGEVTNLIFDFGKIKVNIGEQHFFRMEILENSSEGKISIPAREGYAGANINGQGLNKGINLQIHYFKLSSPVWLIAVFFPFISIAFTMSVMTGKKIEDTLGVSFLATGVLIYCFGLFGKLEWGIWCVYLLAVAGSIYLLYQIMSNRINIFDYITPGILIYFGIMLFFVLVSDGMYRKEWDEYSHWGLAVKDMFIYDSFSKHVNSSILAKRYPPFSTIIEYFFVYINGLFSEKLLYLAYLALLFALLAIVYTKQTFKKNKLLIQSTVIIFSVPLIFMSHYYSLYVDMLLLVIFAYIWVCYFAEKASKFNVIRISLALVALVLTKEMGLILALVFLCVVLTETIYELIRKKGKNIREAIVYVVVTILAFGSWQLYLVAPQADVGVNAVSSAITSSMITTEGISEIVVNEASNYKIEVIKNFITKFLVGKTYKIGERWLSYFAVAVICIFISAYICKKEKRAESKKLSYFVYSSLFFSLGYALFLLLTYLFTFSKDEALLLASHERYLGSCIGGILLAFLILLIVHISQNDIQSKTVEHCINIATGICLFCTGFGVLIPNNIDTYIQDRVFVENNMIEEVVRTFGDKEDAIYYVNNDGGAVFHIVFRDAVMPISSPGLGTFNFYASEEARAIERDIVEAIEEKVFYEGFIMLEETWAERLKGYDYVYLDEPGYVFAETYATLFDNTNDIKRETFYKVEELNGKIKLKYIASFE